MRSRLSSVTVRPRWVLACGVVTLVACALVVVATVVETLVARPDSFVFRPPVTHPQFVHSVVLPITWVLAAFGFWVGLLGLWLRDRRAYGTLRHLLAFASVLGVGLVAVASLGFAVTHLNELVGDVAEPTGMVSALLAVVGGALALVGLCLYGLVLARRGPARRVGVALVGGLPLTAVALSASAFATLLLAVAFGTLGSALVDDPTPAPSPSTEPH
ncbi:hypothetical protein SAMN04487948_101174 [Halogranum amylolyticum]|uniref:Uncharacterized protein n=1 Tax=Halogranum amylolyticum TaxID=660520 RepID=A0A1H8MY70_9EURY|nr:hypothetical protein [Halogranum amylolyticum]SEO22213.1 hypothetical protein SAMN04487948_101174 [Halogranum amylolyticum]